MPNLTVEPFMYGTDGGGVSNAERHSVKHKAQGCSSWHVVRFGTTPTVCAYKSNAIQIPAL